METNATPLTAHILVVDDDREIRQLVGDYLRKNGFRVSLAAEGRQMREMLEASHIDFIVLDLMLPGEDGLTLCRSLRATPAFAQMPVLMLTARGDDLDRIVGLELGADDYVPKPCLPRELAARLRAILRRSQQSAEPAAQAPLLVGPLKLMPAQRRVEWDGTPVELTSTEFNLLEILARNAGRPVSKNDLSAQALGRPLARFDRSIDVHLSSIRHKLGSLPDGRSCIQTVYRQGYQLIRE